MPGRLNGKVAIITGGSTGIGKGMAKIFLSEGAKVAICSRNDEGLRRTIEDIGSNDIIGIRCDVSKADDVKNLISKTVSKFGALHILVNNAGKNPARSFTIEDTTEEEWDEYQAINAKGSFLSSKYAIPGDKKIRRGFNNHDYIYIRKDRPSKCRML